MAKSVMDRSTVRILLTIAMYVGAALSLYPYVASRMSTGIYFLIWGAILAVSCGLLRCYLTDGDCTERHHLAEHSNHTP